MGAGLVAVALAVLAGASLLVHLVTVALSARRYLRALPEALPDAALPFVSLVRPVCGVDPFDRVTLGSGFDLDYPHFEFLFCVEDADDPAADLVRDLMAAHPDVAARLLIGRGTISGNPKLNNVEKGYGAAKGDIIVMTDSNLMLPPDYLRQLMARWDRVTGLVSAPAVGSQPGNFGGALECAFLNTSQARWQLAADALGMGFAQGKTLMFRRDVLEAGGGLAALGRNLAEDVASTKLVRAQGLRVRLAQRLFDQPVGARSLGAVWARQLRWSQIRREGFPALFLLEPFQGPVMSVAALAAMHGAPVVLIPALLLTWYGAEWALARIARWPSAPRDVAAMVLRDLLIPVIWLATWTGRGLEWRGTTVRRAEPTATPR